MAIQRKQDKELTLFQPDTILLSVIDYWNRSHRRVYDGGLRSSLLDN